MAYYNPWSGRAGEEQAADDGELLMLGSDRSLDCGGTGSDLGLNDRIACIGSQHEAMVADVYPPFLGHGTIGDYFDNSLIPNGNGHQVIADTFEEAF